MALPAGPRITSAVGLADRPSDPVLQVVGAFSWQPVRGRFGKKRRVFVARDEGRGCRCVSLACTVERVAMRKPAFETTKSTDLAPSRDELNLAEFPFCLLTD